MKKQLNRSELLGSLPVKRAVLMQILPAIASQMVALAYGIADTYFVGLLNDPDKTAAVTVANAAFLMLTALSNLLMRFPKRGQCFPVRESPIRRGRYPYSAFTAGF